MKSIGINVALRLPFAIDEPALVKDLESCLGQSWLLHFNTKDFQGQWTALSLRSASGKSSDINAGNGDAEFADTPLMERCPAVSRLLMSMEFEKETVRFMRLDPGAEIKEHSDPGLSYRHGAFRLHIPLLTDEEVEFMVGGHLIPMKAGECWYADFDLIHSVRNKSSIPRIHLVVDGKRNEWTDRLFKEAGYDQSIEEKLADRNYDVQTIDRIIESLELMNAPGSAVAIQSMKERKARMDNEHNQFIPAIGPGWIPDSIANENEEWKVHWTFMGDKRFTDPFFHESIKSCRLYYENLLWKGWLGIDTLLKPALSSAVEPSAFVFHISRCGSTLLTQLITEGTDAVVVSEPPVLDEILANQQLTVDRSLSQAIFRSAVAFMGSKPSGKAEHYVIKCDSWHLLYYERIREMYPHVPFILIYRTPGEVMRSHSKMAGMHAVPGFINPSLFGLTQDQIEKMGKGKYLDHVLSVYLDKMNEIVKKDRNAFLLSYHEGPLNMLRRYCTISGLEFSERLEQAAAGRMKYHSKDKLREFSRTEDAEGNGNASEKTQEFFLQLEEKRLSTAKIS